MARFHTGRRIEPISDQVQPLNEGASATILSQKNLKATCVKFGVWFQFGEVRNIHQKVVVEN